MPLTISDWSLCECRHADQTPSQAIEPCPKYAERCQQIQLHSADLALSYGDQQRICTKINRGSVPNGSIAEEEGGEEEEMQLDS